MFEHIQTETIGNVGLIRFHRPKALNALCAGMIPEIARALDQFESDPKIGAIVLTGDEKAFAAGADIKEMAKLGSFNEVFQQEFAGDDWIRASRCRKPIIAAVAGYALGGGCEIAMMCDFIIAAVNAKFGQPEITVGTTPGCGATQRLPRAIGKAKAMEMCLTGRLMDAQEAERMGLVARIVPIDKVVSDAVETAKKIAQMSRPVALLVKECINRSFESPLSDGILFERRVYHACFSLDDQKEGMAAFVEKRTPQFAHR